ncbi:MAG: hypothetical protein HC822_11935 [Oscillochloris sp.]|nr:hypothetical protein [Oscillochloris sp.]
MRYTLSLAGPAWLGEQRLRLTVDGEHVVDVDFRPHDEPTPPLSGRGPIGMLIGRAATRCDSCRFAYGLALCQAAEALLHIEPELRAARVRLGVAENERIAAHLHGLSTIFAAMGLDYDAALLTSLHMEAAAALTGLAGTTPADLLLPGGLSRDPSEAALTAAREQIAGVGRQLLVLADRTIDRRTLLTRTVGIGALGSEAVTGFRLGGPLARATGSAGDVRIDAPYSAYGSITPNVVVQEGGDVYARLVVLLLESLESVRLVESALSDLPQGPWRGVDPDQLPAGSAESLVEAPRGPLRCRLHATGAEMTAHFQPSAPFDRLLARALISGAHLDDAALIAISANPCVGCAGVATA